MADDSTTGEPTWVRDPAGPADIRIHVPRGAHLDAELTAAIEDVLRELANTADSDPAQPSLTCDKKGSCQPMTSGPCYEFSSCRIV